MLGCSAFLSRYGEEGEADEEEKVGESSENSESMWFISLVLEDEVCLLEGGKE